MEPWTLLGNDFRFHLHSHLEVGGSPMTTPPMLYLYFNFGTSTHYFVPPFWRVLGEPNGWRQEVQLMLIAVLRDGGIGSFGISPLADAYCQYFDAALDHFPALYGRALVINAHIDIIPRLPTPLLTIDDVMWVADRRPYNGGREVLVSAPEFEAEFIDDVMMLSPVEDLARGGASSASALLESVKIVTFGEAEGEKVDADDTCSICLDDFEQAQQLYLMPCHHRFHMGCLKKWLARSHACPLCRFDLSLPVPVEE